ncbi:MULTISPECIES: ExbD/TolR family protein [Thauera]|jgi:biopolymer transport protein ExbD|uniref:ExbD/TolR family protein n=1 Tax=Thauera TaxID=33057 RepID=UPI0002CDFCB9|nr:MULTISPECIES: biopolymer transporter ExbD [Thauera]ENO74833.1 biopolymer transport protein ExbD/TolR [Thauera sp. 63]CAH1747063.1 Biopolymer transport protein exbD1 [Thauera humireducens]
MAFGGFNNGDSRPLQSEINMVPLIDVMLVLLIVFMITAPLLTHSVKIDLPQASSQPTQEKPETVSLSINGEGKLFWNNDALDDAALPARLKAAAEQTPQPELHLRADRETRYQKLAEVMSLAREAGIEKMGFITQPSSEPNAR